jgi:hypothetical protein
MAAPPDFTTKPGRIESKEQAHLEVVHPPGPFRLQAAHMKDPRDIPPRDWIYGTHLVRNYVTLLVAAGGTGKSSLVLALCVSIAINRPLLGVKIHEQCNTALLNLEDPEEEVDRRLAALGKYYNVNDTDLAGRFFMSPADQTVTIASASEDGFEVIHPDQNAIIDRVLRENIGVLAVDPFAESHSLEENSNPQMVKAAAAWRRVARLGNCAVLLCHHVRKGVIESIEAARGAKALSDSARVGLLLTPMVEAEAEGLGIPADERLSYVRLDDAKANLAPRAGTASWFHLNTVALDNGTEKHPHGDSVGVIERWRPESPLENLSTADCNLALDRIAAGMENGDAYTWAKQSKRWGGRVLCDLFGKTDGQAAEIIRIWLANKVLFQDRKWTGSRNSRGALRVNEVNRPGTSYD